MSTAKKNHLPHACALASLSALFFSSPLTAQSPELYMLPEPASIPVEQDVTIPASFAPFGQRPQTDKSGDDGSSALRDPNGVIVWSTSKGNPLILPNTGLAKTLYVSDSECVVYNNRFAADYNQQGSSSQIIIYRRQVNANGTAGAVASPTITVTGTLVDTAPITPTTFGYTLISAVGFNLSPTESSSTVQTGTTQDGRPIYNTIRVDQWDDITYSMNRLTFDGELQRLGSTTVPVPKSTSNLGQTRVLATGDDGSSVITTIQAFDFAISENPASPLPNNFRSGQGNIWATWQFNSETIVAFPSTLAPVSDVAYVSNQRLIMETPLDPDQDPAPVPALNDYRMRSNGIFELVGSEDLPIGQSLLPVTASSRSGQPPFIYTLDTATGTALSLFRYDATLEPVGVSVTLPASLVTIGNYVRNPADASLLIKAEGATGVLWIPATANGGLRTPVSLPGSSLAQPMFVSSTEAIAWMNASAAAVAGVIPLANIAHFSEDPSDPLVLLATTITVDSPSAGITSPILGRYVAIPPQLTPDPETEGWSITTFEKTADRTATVRVYKLRTATTLDSDGEGLLDSEELFYDTDPKNPDTDGDGITDGQEIYPYYRINSSFTYEQARLDAIRRGGILATPDTLTQQGGLMRVLGSLPFGSKFWLGGGDFDGPNDVANVREGSYRWMHSSGLFFDDAGNSIGTSISEFNWAPGQPTNVGNADAMVLRPDYKWEMGVAARSYGYVFQFIPSDPNSVDSDIDELTDAEEYQLGTNPTLDDTDGDGVSDLLEVRGYSWDSEISQFVINREASGFTSNPLKKDSDDDGIEDLDEVRSGTNPLNTDTDGDGLSDREEQNGGTNPLREDTDGDGFSDYEEVTAIPSSDPNDPDNRPAPGQLVPRNPNMHNRVQFERQQSDVTIPASFSPFGNRSDYNRFGDDGSAMILDVNGVLLWQDASGLVRNLPDSEYAVPLVVSGNEAIVWTNAFDPARILGGEEAALQVAVYRVDPATGNVGVPTQLDIRGQHIVPTAPTTATTQAYTIVSLEHRGEGDDGGSTAFVYRMTFAGNAQLISQIGIPNLDGSVTAQQKVRALGHGSDGSLVFSIDANAYFYGRSINGQLIAIEGPPRQTEDNTDDDLFDFDIISDHRRIFWINGSHPGPSGVVEELSSGTRIANYNGDLPARVLSTSASRVVYQTAENGILKDARRNSITSALTRDQPLALPIGFTEEFLRISTQTREGDIRWLYTAASNGSVIKAYRLTNTGLQPVYEAQLAPGQLLDGTATVTKINPLDGSAVISPDGGQLLWIFNNLRGAELPNVLLVPNTLNARAMYVQRNELVIWGNARDTLNNIGGIRNVDLRHYEQKDGAMVNPSGGFVNLSPKVNGRFILDTPSYTPDFSLWRVTTVEKSTPTSARFRSYLLVPYASLDTDGDEVPDLVEVDAGTASFNNDSDGDDLTDSDELYPYYVVNGTFTWAEAEADAVARGGRLAVVTNQDDYTGLKRRFKGLTAFDLWLGATDQVVEGSWKWGNGATLNVTEWRKPGMLSWAAYYTDISTIPVPWAIGKPDDANNADGLVLRSDLFFEDRPVLERRGYLIEYPRSNPINLDSDGDGRNDFDERRFASDPNVRDSFAGVPILPSPVGNVPFLSIGNTYYHLVYDPEQGEIGMMTVKLSTKGAFTYEYKGLNNKIKASGRGAFSGNGAYSGPGPKGLSDVTSLNMQMVQESGIWKMVAVMTRINGKQLGSEGFPPKYSKSNPYPAPGTLTMALPLAGSAATDVTEPSGEGVATGSIDRAGMVKANYILPNGEQSTSSGPILVNDYHAVHAWSSKGRKCALVGAIDMVSARPSLDYGGTLRLYAVASTVNGQATTAIDQARLVEGSVYIPPSKGLAPLSYLSLAYWNISFNLLGGAFDGVSKVASWGADNKIVIPPSPTTASKAAYNPKTGLMTFGHTETDPILKTSTTANGYAVVLQRPDQTRGYYLTPLSSGRLSVTEHDGSAPPLTMIAPVAKTVPVTASVYNVQVSTPGAWQVVLPPDPWVTVEIVQGRTGELKGNGNGIVRITVPANPTGPPIWRYLTIEIAGIKHNITQDYMQRR